MNYYRRHVGDYIRDTSHLSLLEHGIYARLMDVYYITEEPLADESIARLIGARTSDERGALENVLNDFFELSEGKWTQPRCKREIDAYKAKAEVNREVGKLGGRPKKPTNNPNGFAQEPTGTLTNNQEPITNKEKRASPPAPFGFEDFWSAYPNKVGKDAAIKAYAKRRPSLPLLEMMLRALKTQAASEAWCKDGGQFIPHPSTWLNEGRWQDEGVTVQAVPPSKPSSWLADQAAHRAQAEAERLARKQAA